MICTLRRVKFSGCPPAQRPEKLRAKAVYAVLTGKEVPGLRGPLQKFQRTAVPRNHLRKGQGKFIGDADLHQKFQKVAVPLHHHMAFQISGKSLHDLLRQFRAGALSFQHSERSVPHSVGIALTPSRHKCQLFLCDGDSL